VAMAIPNQGLEQNGALSDLPLSAAHLDPAVERIANPPYSEDDQDLQETPLPVATAEDVDMLRAENAALRCTVDELEKLLEERMQLAESLAERQRDQETLLEEKSEVIRELHIKLQECSAAGIPRESAASPREEELLALSEELELERRQLREDEEALTAQMREMEVQMSRERAELARQRNDLQRLHSEIIHELELASRQASLRDRLQPLQRRHQEMLHRKGFEPAREAPPPVPTNPTPASAPTPVPEVQEPERPKDHSGLLRRLFG
jgi:hypothetical protein